MRENYTSFPNWTLEEYLHNYHSEKAMDNLIYAGKLPACIDSLKIYDSNQIITIETMPTVTILCGIPTSGKSTWTKEQIKYSFDVHVSISRDDIRFKLWGPNYKFSKVREDLVTSEFVRLVQLAIKSNKNVILDNTHCKESYIDAAIKTFSAANYNIKVKFFEVSLWNAYCRNVKRLIREGNHKWIPFRILRQFKKNYDKLNKEKYARYTN